MSMVAVKYNLLIAVGATYRKTMRVNQGDPAVPVDLTGHRFRLQVRETLESGTVLVDMTTENDPASDPAIVLLDQTQEATKGKFQLVIPSTVTADYAWEEGVYDLEWITDLGPPEEVNRIAEGKVKTSPNVTR